MRIPITVFISMAINAVEMLIQKLVRTLLVNITPKNSFGDSFRV